MDECGRLRGDAFYQLIVHCFFPASIEDREMALTMIRHEEARLQAVGADNYRMSQMTRDTLRAAQKRSAKLALCGYTALAMVSHDNAGKEMALQTAAKIVSELFYSVGKVHWVSWIADEPVERQMAASGDIADIKKAFRQYKSVAHICAARVAAAEYLAPMPFLERAPDAEACLIQTAAYFQGRLMKAAGSSDWQMWDVLTCRPAEIQEHPALIPSDETVMNIFRPWFEARPAKG